MFRVFRSASVYIGSSALLFGLLAAPARAVDLNSQDLIPAPAGTNAMLGYFSYGDYGSFVSTNGTTYKDGTDMKSLVGIARYVHYMSVGGVVVAPQVLLPYGKLFDGSLGGAKLDSASGAGDPILALPVWLVNNPRTTFAVVPYLYIPTGAYVPGRTLNLGENRWKFDLQVGGTQQLGHGFATQLSADVMWYGNNGDATGTGTGTLRQNNTYQFQGWLTYTPPADKTWTVAAGYSKYWGGVQYLDGAANGQATRVDQIRLEVSKFVTPTFQIQGLLEHDIKVNGGFKQDIYATLRLLKLF